MGLRVGVGEDTGVRLKHSSSSSLSLLFMSSLFLFAFM